MDERRQREPWSWRGLVLSILAGALLALFCRAWLGRSGTPAPVEVSREEAAGQQSVGFEFVMRFRVLLPDSGKKDDR